MSLPSVGTIGRDILEFLFDAEAATLEEIRSSLKDRHEPSIVSSALSRNRADRAQVVKRDGLWQLTAPGRVLIDKARNPAPNIVPARTFIVNRPLDPKHFIKTTANRHDATMPPATGYLVSGTSPEPFIRGK